MKNRRLSNISESRIPSVVRIAISDAANSTTMTHRSTPVRARKVGELRRAASTAAASATSSATEPPIMA